MSSSAVIQDLERPAKTSGIDYFLSFCMVPSSDRDTMISFADVKGNTESI